MAFGGDLERVPIQERQKVFKQTEKEQTNQPGSETSFAISFSRMRSEGRRVLVWSSGGLQVGVVFAQRCSSDRKRSQMFAVRALSLPVGRRSKCDQDDVLEFDVIAKCMVVAFCDMRGGCVCVLRGSTLEAFLN